MTNPVQKKRSLCDYMRHTAGTIMAAFAIMAPFVVGSVGMATDVSQAYLVRQRLGGALDASALAAASSATEAAEIQERVELFFNANYPEEKIGTAYNLQVEVTDEDVIVSASADYNTTFMRVLGIDSLTVNKTTVVHREVRGLEVVLVLDNTGSMSTNNNIEALKQASRDFIDILYDHASEPEDVKIGIVPYSNSVRVGRYGLGFEPDGTTPYGDGTPFVTLPSGVTYTTNHENTNTSRWYGCVIESNESGWRTTVTDNDPYPRDMEDEYEGPWEAYLFSNRTCTTRDRYGNCTAYGVTRQSPVNQGCPYANILPLTSDREAMDDTIDAMVPEGNTLGNIGMVWGHRLISPEAPFEEANDWDDPRWRKAVVMMTDGDNTLNGTYSSYWLTYYNNITVTNLNTRFEETCNAMKEQGVIVYTVVFTSAVNNTTKGYYSRCATSPDQYFYAPSQADLRAVFERISRELANLHISN